jgi:hypothetical protein
VSMAAIADRGDGGATLIGWRELKSSLADRESSWQVRLQFRGTANAGPPHSSPLVSRGAGGSRRPEDEMVVMSNATRHCIAGSQRAIPSTVIVTAIIFFMFSNSSFQSDMDPAVPRKRVLEDSSTIIFSQ